METKRGKGSFERKEGQTGHGRDEGCMRLSQIGMEALQELALPGISPAGSGKFQSSNLELKVLLPL